jgi:hypothetical protein
MMAQTQAFRDEVKRRAANPKPAKPPLDPDSAAAREIKGGFEDRAMAELATQDRRATKPKRDDKPRMVADDIVTTNSLATHLGCTRQNIARLVAEANIEQRSDGCFDQTASRLKYIRHLREMQRRSPRVEADAEHTKIKSELLQIRLMEKKKQLVRLDEVTEMIDNLVGIVLTAMSGMAARCSPHDLAVRPQ